jgi:hypothetical protein
VPAPIWCAALSRRRWSAAIAAADGIDYIESQSAQGLSTINVRLKLNVSAAAALADISARVNQVRADLPPEAEVPAIAIEPSDSVLASMYLSFGSTILEQNQLTDYLIRVVQPRLSALEGVQKADILGVAYVCDSGVAEARADGGAQRESLAGAAGAGGQQLPVGGGADQGGADSAEPDGGH